MQLLLAGSKSIRKTGQGLPGGLTEDQIKKQYQDYLAGQQKFTKQVEEANAQAQAWNSAHPKSPPKMIQSKPVIVDYQNFRASRIGEMQARQDMVKSRVSPEALQTYQLADKLIKGLFTNDIFANTIKPGDPDYVKREVPLQFPGGVAPQIKPENLETLGDFLTWAAANKITWDGQRIAWDYTPADPDVPNSQPSGADAGEKIPEDAWVFTSYQRNPNASTLRDPNRQPITKTYYANKDGLLKFLAYLRDSDTAKKNKVFEVMIGKVITQTNTFLKPNEQLGAREPEKPKDQFNKNDLVDGFPGAILDPQQPYAGLEQYMPKFNGAPQRMTYDDISSFANLQSWLSGMSLPDRKNPVGTDGNPCPIINILYLRAKFLAGRQDLDRLRPGYNALAKTYLKNITEFGKQFTYQDKPCDVITPNAGTQQPGKDQKGQAQNAQVAASLAKVIGALPLKLTDINFSRISTFLQIYGTEVPRLTATSTEDIQFRAGNINTQIQQASQAMKAAMAETTQGRVSTFPGMEQLAAGTVESWCQQPASAHSRNLVAQLKVVVGAVLGLISDLETAFAEQLDEAGRSKIRDNQYAGQNNIERLDSVVPYLSTGRPGER